MFLGNSQIKEYFDKLVKSDALSHAYLFHGPQGVGKKLLALKISEEISGPIATNPDLRIIDKRGEEIHIADIRELRNFMHLTPFGKYKIAILNNAHNLGRDASNALLKILEEPPGKSILFLITHLPKILLGTLRSRCQSWHFKPLKTKEIEDYLISKKTKKDTVRTIAALSRGLLALALELADNFENFQKNISLLDKLVKTDFKGRFETAKKISADSEDLKGIVGDWFIYSLSLADKKLAKEVLHLSNTLSRPQFNHRLALDNFLVNL